MRNMIIAFILVLMLSAPVFGASSYLDGVSTAGSGSSSSTVSGKVCKTVTNPSAADTKLWFDIASTRTVTKLWGICTGGTSVEATLKNGGADGTGSTTIAALTGANIVDTDGASQTTISSASLTNGDMIFLTIGTVTGVVTQVMVCYE